MDTPPTNDLITQLEQRLSPAGRKALEEITVLEIGLANAESIDSMAPETEASLDTALEILGTLPAREQGVVLRIFQLRGRAYEDRAAEDREDAKKARLAVSVIERAQALERGAGREPEESMTLGEALAIFRVHGEPTPEHLDTERFVGVLEEEERIVPTFYPDFGNPDRWSRWDGSEQAEAWAKLMYFRDRCIADSVSKLVGMDFHPIDYTRLITFLWTIGEDEADELVRLRQKGF
jgi:hypothetical protein